MKATSSRRSASKALLALGLASFGGASAAAYWRWSHSGGPRLAIRPGPRPAARPREGLYLALCSMPEAVRADLVSHLASALASASPLAIDIGGDRVEDVILERRPWLLPLLNAALTLADGTFPLREGHVMALPPGRGEEAAIEAWGPPDAAADRARYAAWPLSFGLRVRLPSSSATRRAYDALRAVVARPQSSLSLVVDASSSLRRTPIDLADLPSLAGPASRKAPRLDPLERMVLDALATPGLPGEPLPWLSLRDDELLVSPRQSMLARPDDVIADLRAALGSDAATTTVVGPGASGPRRVE